MSMGTSRSRPVMIAAIVAAAIVGAGTGAAVARAVAGTESDAVTPGPGDKDYRGVIAAVYRLLDAYNQADPAALREASCGVLRQGYEEQGDPQVRADAQTLLDERGMGWFQTTTVLFDESGQSATALGLIVYEKTEFEEFYVGLTGEPIGYEVEFHEGAWKVCDIPPNE